MRANLDVVAGTPSPPTVTNEQASQPEVVSLNTQASPHDMAAKFHISRSRIGDTLGNLTKDRTFLLRKGEMLEAKCEALEATVKWFQAEVERLQKMVPPVEPRLSREARLEMLRHRAAHPESALEINSRVAQQILERHPNDSDPDRPLTGWELD